MSIAVFLIIGFTEPLSSDPYSVRTAISAALRPKMLSTRVVVWIRSNEATNLGVAIGQVLRIKFGQ